jgi:hypothetical protein
VGYWLTATNPSSLLLSSILTLDSMILSRTEVTIKPVSEETVIAVELPATFFNDLAAWSEMKDYLFPIKSGKSPTITNGDIDSVRV